MQHTHPGMYLRIERYGGAYCEQASTPATVSHQLDQQLVDGHWVLAFPDPAAALQAKQLLEERAAALRILYARVLQPLLVPTGSPVASSV